MKLSSKPEGSKYDPAPVNSQAEEEWSRLEKLKFLQAQLAPLPKLLKNTGDTTNI